MSTNTRSTDWYNQNAQNYTAHVKNPDDSIYHSLYEKPAMYALLPPLEGLSVISLGCGSGEDCHHLLSQGARQVTGIDLSDELIKIAKNSYPSCTFEVMDMESLHFDDESFDFVYSSLAIHYIENWTKTFKEIYRILKPGSFFLFSCDHPVYSALKIVKDDTKGKKSELSRSLDRSTNRVKITGDYLSRRAIAEAYGMAVTTWHKPIGEITKEATSAGFLIADIVEPQPLTKMKELSLKDYETLKKIPNFIIFKLYKP